MKRLFVLGMTAGLLLSVAGCKSAPASSSGSGRGGLSGVPDFVNAAYMNASEDVLVGIGTYRIGNDMSKMGTGKTYAETRAQADISRQLITIVKNMVNDYSAGSEIDPDAVLSFQESITQTLSKSTLSGVRTIQMDTDGNGLLWVVMEIGKNAATDEVNQAVNAARLAIPGGAAFDALRRMDAALSKEAGGGPVPVFED
jgi:hypothetical protein